MAERRKACRRIADRLISDDDLALEWNAPPTAIEAASQSASSVVDTTCDASIGMQNVADSL